jgi:hypothetical protein
MPDNKRSSSWLFEGNVELLNSGTKRSAVFMAHNYVLSFFEDGFGYLEKVECLLQLYAHGCICGNEYDSSGARSPLRVIDSPLAITRVEGTRHHLDECEYPPFVIFRKHVSQGVNRTLLSILNSIINLINLSFIKRFIFDSVQFHSTFLYDSGSMA